MKENSYPNLPKYSKNNYQLTDMMKSNRTESFLWAAKLVFFSVGIVSAFVLVRVSVIPFVSNILLSLCSGVPSFVLLLKSWLSPPYIYIILNLIILVVVVSSSSTSHNDHNTNRQPVVNKIEKSLKRYKTTNQVKTDSFYESSWDETTPATATATPTEPELLIYPASSSSQELELDMLSAELEVEMKNNTTGSIEIKPKAVSFIDSSQSHKKLKPLDKSHNKDKEDSLEATWKNIIEGNGKKMTRQLTKSETWNTRPCQLIVGNNGDADGVGDPVAWAKRELKKSDTFNDSASLRREKSMTQDELNSRVEAFISKFNREMSLQRQESDHRRFVEMVHGGV